MAYTYYRSMTIAHAKVPNTDQIDFPVLVTVTDATLKDVAHSGHVNSSSGFDLVFSSNNTGSSLLSWEMESYDPVNGVVLAWVKVPTVATASDTVFYMVYGNAAIASFQGGATGASWNSNYVAVYHLGNGATVAHADSSANAHTLTDENAAPTAIAGAFSGGAAAFAGGSYNGPNVYVSGQGLSTGITDMTFAAANAGTLEWWANPQFATNDGKGYQMFGAVAWNGSASVLPEFAGWGHEQGGNFDVGWNVSGTDGRCNVDTIATGYFAQNTWQHYALVWNSGTKSLLYRNGVLIKTAVNNASLSNATGTFSIGMQRSNGGGGTHDSCFLGYEDEFRISKSVRTADWITTNYNNQSSPATFLTMGAENSSTVNATATPSGVTSAFAENNPTTSGGSTATPSGVTASFTENNPSTSGTALVVPAGVTASFTEHNPTISVSVVAFPAGVTASFAEHNPTISVSVVAFPAGVTAHFTEHNPSTLVNNRIVVTGGGFQASDGSSLANGYVLLTLGSDQRSGGGQIASKITTKIPLDASGNVSGLVYVFPNDFLSDPTSIYWVAVYSAAGELVWGPSPQKVLTPSPFDLTTWVP